MVVARVIRVTVVFSMLIAAQTPTVHGDCMRIPLRTAQRHADMMFSGTVTSIEPTGVGVMLAVDVDQVWKGRVRRVTKIYQQMNSETRPCEAGRRYVFVAPNYAVRNSGCYTARAARSS